MKIMTYLHMDLLEERLQTLNTSEYIAKVAPIYMPTTRI